MDRESRDVSGHSEGRDGKWKRGNGKWEMKWGNRIQVRLSTARYRAFGAQTMPRTVSRNLNGDDVSNSKKHRSTFDRYLRYFFRCRLFSTILFCPRLITRSLRKMQEINQKRGIYALLTSIKNLGGVSYGKQPCQDQQTWMCFMAEISARSSVCLLRSLCTSLNSST